MADRKTNILFSCSAPLAVAAAMEYSDSKAHQVSVVMLITVFLIVFLVPQTFVAMLDTAAEAFTDSESVLGKNVWFFSRVLSVIISAVIIIGGILGFINAIG
jgi:hypothetical protein